MNWFVFSVFAYLALVVEGGLALLLEIGGVSPGFVLTLAVFVGFWAPSRLVPWALLILGLLEDLTHTYAIGPHASVPLIGPHCLGYLAAGYACLQMRSVVMRDSPVAVAFGVVVAGIFVHLVVVAVLTVRGLPILDLDRLANWSAADELIRRFFAVLYTAAVALPFARLLIRTAPLWRFVTTQAGLRRAMRSRG